MLAGEGLEADPLAQDDGHEQREERRKHDERLLENGLLGEFVVHSNALVYALRRNASPHCQRWLATIIQEPEALRLLKWDLLVPHVDMVV
jgi:hypothetical protein